MGPRLCKLRPALLPFPADAKRVVGSRLVWPGPRGGPFPWAPAFGGARAAPRVGSSRSWLSGLLLVGSCAFGDLPSPCSLSRSISGVRGRPAARASPCLPLLPCLQRLCFIRCSPVRPLRQAPTSLAPSTYCSGMTWPSLGGPQELHLLGGPCPVARGLLLCLCCLCVWPTPRPPGASAEHLYSGRTCRAANVASGRVCLCLLPGSGCGPGLGVAPAQAPDAEVVPGAIGAWSRLRKGGLPCPPPVRHPQPAGTPLQGVSWRPAGGGWGSGRACTPAGPGASCSEQLCPSVSQTGKLHPRVTKRLSCSAAERA